MSDVPEAATETRLRTPPSLRHRTARLRRDANPAAGTGRDYFRPHRLPSQRKTDSFSVRAQRWWANHRPH
ncbi:hypothetical protein [Hymenobacter rigui]|uniref:Uncharacterized protein n=1 Tax=Hymenobacter rigui TaxID=334424 RepID=A0A428K9Q2_9BACT|nr:hypothetical protein [Hymenobacter rigui]RSK43102.1 hypothetical protein EI291_22350 [Hymenobacter rigui]